MLFSIIWSTKHESTFKSKTSPKFSVRVDPCNNENCRVASLEYLPILLEVNTVHVFYYEIKFRDHRWKGLTQDINVQGGHLYKLTAYMKLLNVAPGHMYEEVETMVACALSNGRL